MSEWRTETDRMAEAPKRQSVSFLTVSPWRRQPQYVAADATQLEQVAQQVDLTVRPHLSLD
jgi:hypothetical protein